MLTEQQQMLHDAASHSHAGGAAVPGKSGCLEDGHPARLPCSVGSHKG